MILAKSRSSTAGLSIQTIKCRRLNSLKDRTTMYIYIRTTKRDISRGGLARSRFFRRTSRSMASLRRIKTVDMTDSGCRRAGEDESISRTRNDRRDCRPLKLGFGETCRRRGDTRRISRCRGETSALLCRTAAAAAVARSLRRLTVKPKSKNAPLHQQ